MTSYAIVVCALVVPSPLSLPPKLFLRRSHFQLVTAVGESFYPFREVCRCFTNFVPFSGMLPPICGQPVSHGHRGDECGHCVAVAGQGRPILVVLVACRAGQSFAHCRRDGRAVLLMAASTSSIAVCAIGRLPMLRGAGLVSFFPRRGPEVHQRIQALKDEQGTGRSVMVIGSSGAGNLVDHVGDLSSVLDKCLEAKILLVNPFHREVRALHGDIGPSRDNPVPAIPREDVRQSIALLTPGVSKRWGKS